MTNWRLSKINTVNKPVAVPVAIDALAVMVNKDNPIKGLTVPQVDAIFSSTRKCGHETDIQTWGEAGVSAWGSKSIQLYGRNSVSQDATAILKKRLV